LWVITPPTYGVTVQKIQTSGCRINSKLKKLLSNYKAFNSSFGGFHFAA